MCECGCVYNDRHYRFDGPEKEYYVVTVNSACKDCDAPAGFAIRHFKPGDSLYEWFLDNENSQILSFEDWGEFGLTAQFTTGMTRSEFIKATLNHLVGINSKHFGEKGTIDADGADAILDEMYADATTKPHLVDSVNCQEG